MPDLTKSQGRSEGIVLQKSKFQVVISTTTKIEQKFWLSNIEIAVAFLHSLIDENQQLMKIAAEKDIKISSEDIAIVVSNKKNNIQEEPTTAQDKWIYWGIFVCCALFLLSYI